MRIPAAADVIAHEWVTPGRQLLPLRPVVHRHGLNVNVQPEIKDSPANASALVRILGPEHHAPFARFSVGRSTGAVPRSYRR